MGAHSADLGRNTGDYKHRKNDLSSLFFSITLGHRTAVNIHSTVFIKGKAASGNHLQRGGEDLPIPCFLETLLVFLGHAHSSSKTHEMVIRELEDAGPDLRASVERVWRRLQSALDLRLNSASCQTLRAQGCGWTRPHE